MTLEELEKRGDLVTVQEVAELWRTHENTIYRAIERGTLPAVRIPGGIRIAISVIRRYGTQTT